MKNSFSWDDKPKAFRGPSATKYGPQCYWAIDDSIYTQKNGVSHGYHELYDHNGFLWYRGHLYGGNEVGYYESYGVSEGHIFYLEVRYNIR